MAFLNCPCGHDDARDIKRQRDDGNAGALSMISELEQKAGFAVDGLEHGGGLDVVTNRLEGCRLARGCRPQRRHARAPLRGRRTLSSGFSDFDASRDRATCSNRSRDKSIVTVNKDGKFDMAI